MLLVSSGRRSRSSAGRYLAFSPDSSTSTNALKTIDAVNSRVNDDSGATSHSVRERTMSNPVENSRYTINVVDGCMLRVCSRYDSEQNTNAVKSDNEAATVDDHDRKPC